VSRSAVRLLTLSMLFPNARNPRHGIFVANRLRRICDTGRVDATVIAALPRFPGRYREFADVPRRVAEGQTIIDFVRVCDSRTVLGVYEGLCW